MNPLKHQGRVTLPVANTLRRKGGMSQVGATLSGLLARYGLDEAFARYEFVRYWEEIVGEEIAKRTRPECIRNGTLIVGVQNAMWAQELSFNKRAILSRLKGRLPKNEVVRDVSFFVSQELAAR